MFVQVALLKHSRSSAYSDPSEQTPEDVTSAIRNSAAVGSATVTSMLSIASVFGPVGTIDLGDLLQSSNRAATDYGLVNIGLR